MRTRTDVPQNHLPRRDIAILRDIHPTKQIQTLATDRQHLLKNTRNIMEENLEIK